MISCETLDQLQALPDQQWVLLPAFFTETELQHLKQVAMKRWERGQFEPAKVGRSQERQRATQVRSDWTSWIDLEDPLFSAFSEKIEALRVHFNQKYFLGLKEFEGHFARYSEGQFYEEHIDQSPTLSPLHGVRVISFVLYLNENWRPGDGGELSLRLQEKEIRIQPHWGHVMLFLSDTVPHAVLPALRERWSLTGWFRRS